MIKKTMFAVADAARHVLNGALLEIESGKDKRQKYAWLRQRSSSGPLERPIDFKFKSQISDSRSQTIIPKRHYMKCGGF